MGKRRGLVLGIAASLIFIGAGFVFAQEAIEQGGAVPQGQTEPDVQWVWGEVTSVDAQNKTILIKYLDYETDQEKEISIATDAKTTYENVQSLDQIKPKDVLSIDYTVDPQGNSVAKNISVEKPDNTQLEQEANTPEEKANTAAPTQ